MSYSIPQGSLIGSTVGNYRVIAKIGEGGMGSVYLAEHPLIGKRVALKVLLPELSYNQAVVARFFNEARVVNSIQHPHIVDIIDYGAVPAHGAQPPMVYLLMEYLEGVSLTEVIRSQAPLGVERAFHICYQIADALHASHQASIVHRDLKPDNIMLVSRTNQPDFVKVLDFGIAKLLDERSHGPKTQTGMLLGTPAYMSPEQCDGSSSVDHRTDVYALGVVLFECLTGLVPFRGQGFTDVVLQQVTRPPPVPSELCFSVPPVADAIVLRALQKSPAHRFADMQEFMAALSDPGAAASTWAPPALGDAIATRRLAPGAPTIAAPSGSYEHPSATQQQTVATAGRRRWVLPVAMAATVGLGIGGAGLWKIATGDGSAAVAAPSSSTVPAPQPAAPAPSLPAPSAPAPAPSAAPDQEDDMVEIRLQTLPESGARIVDERTGELLGETPFRWNVARGGESISLRFERDGFESRSRVVSLDANREIEVVLTPVRSSSSRKSSPKRDSPKEERATPKKDAISDSDFLLN